MNVKPKDHRPKVISFRSALNGLDIAARQSILWPCHAFTISIPQKKKNGLNVFEESVLKITEVESGDTEKISDIFCLHKDLVVFIQNRLNHLGLLNERYELSDEGKKLLGSWENADDESHIDYVVGTVFIDLHSGKILPYVHLGNLKQEKIVSIDDSIVYVEFGSTGTSSQQKCRLIRPFSESYWQIVPDSNDVIRAIRAFKKKYKRYALLNKEVDQYPPFVPMAEAISVNEDPELVYLHCNILIQKGSSNLLVTDGFGFGFSESFAKYLIFQDWKWLTDLRQKGVVDNFGNVEGSDNQSTGKLFKHKYFEISRRIKESKSALEKIKNLKVNSTYYESAYRQEIENGIKYLYAALEWSLRQVIADNPVDEWRKIFSSNNFQENEKLLINFAKKIGFLVNEKNRGLLQVKAGAIRQIEHGKVELQPLLALGIAGANGNANHPVHRLAQNHSGFLNHALMLKKYRDPIEHGNTEKLNIDDKMLEELIESIVPMIISLIPGVDDDLGGVGNVANGGDVNQERLKADVELEKSLGTAFVSSLSGDIREQLIRSEIMLETYTDDKAIEIIKCYASVMQHALFDAVNDHKLEIESNEKRESALDKIIHIKFYASANQIPQEISTVSPHNIRRAVQGSSTTLGAHLLALFLLGTENELIQLQKSVPEFVDFVAKLIRLRGHGNKLLSDFLRDDMESLKKNVFKVIKSIKDIF